MSRNRLGRVLKWHLFLSNFEWHYGIVLPFMAKCSNVPGWRYNMRYLSIYGGWKFKQIRKQVEHRLYTWVFLYHILKTEYFLSYYFLSYFAILRKSYHIFFIIFFHFQIVLSYFLSYFKFSNMIKKVFISYVLVYKNMI